MEWSELAPSLTGQAHAATADDEGHPHVSIVWTVVEGDVVWFATRRSSKKARNLAVNDRLALTWQTSGEIYLDGTARLVDDPDHKRHVWSLLPYDPAQFFGSADNPDLLFVEVAPVKAVRFSAGPDGPARSRWHHGRP